MRCSVFLRHPLPLLSVSLRVLCVLHDLRNSVPVQRQHRPGLYAGERTSIHYSCRPGSPSTRQSKQLAVYKLFHRKGPWGEKIKLKAKYTGRIEPAAVAMTGGVRPSDVQWTRWNVESRRLRGGSRVMCDGEMKNVSMRRERRGERCSVCPKTSPSRLIDDCLKSVKRQKTCRPIKDHGHMTQFQTEKVKFL